MSFQFEYLRTALREYLGHFMTGIGSDCSLLKVSQQLSTVPVLDLKLHNETSFKAKLNM
jgi:hypothetical protein